jgi:hypothetical protein
MHHVDPFRPEAAAPPYIAPAPDPELLVQGTSSEVLSWVGNSASRANKALEAEMFSNDPRKTLIAKLEKIL